MRHELVPDLFDTDPPKDVIKFTSANGIYKLKIELYVEQRIILFKSLGKCKRLIKVNFTLSLNQTR